MSISQRPRGHPGSRVRGLGSGVLRMPTWPASRGGLANVVLAVALPREYLLWHQGMIIMMVIVIVVIILVKIKII